MLLTVYACACLSVHACGYETQSLLVSVVMVVTREWLVPKKPSSGIWIPCWSRWALFNLLLFLIWFKLQFYFERMCVRVSVVRLCVRVFVRRVWEHCYYAVTVKRITECNGRCSGEQTLHQAPIMAICDTSHSSPSAWCWQRWPCSSYLKNWLLQISWSSHGKSSKCEINLSLSSFLY